MKIMVRLVALVAVVSAIVVYGAFRKNNLTSELRQAVEQGDARAVADLLRQGAKQTDTPNQVSPLTMAIQKHEDDIAIALIHAGPEGPPARFLCRALMEKRSAVVVELLRTRMDLNRPCVLDKLTPLMVAVEKAGTGEVRALLDRGADPNQPCTSPQFAGHTAVSLAVVSQNVPCLRLLLERGGNPNVRVDANYPTTPLLIASFIGDLDSVRLLLSHHADPNAKDKEGRTPYQLVQQQIQEAKSGSRSGSSGNGGKPTDTRRLERIASLLKQAGAKPS